MKPDRTLEVYADTGSRWRWRSRSANGQIISISGQSFASRWNAMRAARREAAAVEAARRVVVKT